MNIHNIKNPLEKILRRLESLKDASGLHELDRKFLTEQLQEAYNALHDADFSSEVSKDNHPGKNSYFEFEEEEPKPQKEPVPPQPKEKTKPQMQAAAPPTDSAINEKTVSSEKQTEEKTQPANKENVNGEQVVEKQNDDELDALFQIKESTELSERLSQLPIDDIWAAMGLNERIFTQNELFGGQSETFRSTVSELNKCDTFEEAKERLKEGPIIEFNWTAPDRKNIAKNFIRLVKRKYT
jgi:hypothetical protein